ncbi:conserved hypothetical protein [Beutenbergia cavernae DSM 12333]|uniref:Hydrolase n=1 Tax=Beutenbergia cavernae (strain ATCC BAA-8 / DSM 12333 / CCUG 43141 / JCM 11478 / NBRC 16432 / NCIMB 13614 / HKI 0122) TaxID=471853 RepID=C5BZ20_BEUC1|nr:zinc-dependent metalloprotease [Beutenbergia cavernae]ACQ81135.1 conserved hypothetical protein [Beutenbergia cavernae DSM 12333]
MSDETDDDARRTWRALLRSMLGEEGAEEAMRALEANGFDPGAMAQAAGLPLDPAQLQSMMAQMQRMLANPGGGPVNWTLAHDVARQAAHTGGDPSVTAAQAAQVTSALGVADLWLDVATDLPPAGGRQEAWSRATWVESTLPTWKRLAEPIAASVAQALVTALASRGEDVVPGMGADASGVLRQLGGTVFGMQVGQAVGTLASEVFGVSDTGLPLLETPGSALVVANVAAFADGLDAPVDEVRHFLAVREVAHARLFAHVPWLRAHVLGLVEEYSRGIVIDTERMEDAVRSIDPSDPEALRGALSSGVFALERSEAQEAALGRLETALALIEGWVEDVTARAVAPHLPHAVPLREMLRRRRAAGGPAEQTFAALVGLELRPRRAREAAVLWASLVEHGGAAERESVWEHPDLLPTADDLDDAAGYRERRAARLVESTDLDSALADLLATGEAEWAAERDAVDGGAHAGGGAVERESAADKSDGESEDVADGDDDDGSSSRER